MARDFEAADRSYETSLRMCAELGDRRGVASAKTRLAYRAVGRGDIHLGRRLLDESDEDARGRFVLIEAQNVSLRAYLAVQDGVLDEADALLHRGLALASGLRWAWWEAHTLEMRMDLARRRGDYEQAERYGRSALALGMEHEDRLGMADHMTGLAQVALARGDLERAGMLWGTACAEGERLPEWEDRVRSWASDLLAEGRPEFVDAIERGRRLDLWDAAAVALGEDEPHTVP
jgi:ATP/maltotriose-dependent transcriptional regulator MalT